ncbi:MAG TPA: YciI family protein [Candidatus Krumholzibacteria bacterium]|nr:YciI family protein [Candidatus Krumholzibacteria bacterium]
MSDDPNKNLSDAEQRALRSLGGEIDPSPELEGRVVADLKRRGAIRANGGWIMKISKTAAAAIIVAAAFAGGFAMGSRGETATAPADVATTTPATDANQYMLLMYMRVDPTQAADAPAEEPMNEEAYRAIIDEYRQWALDREKEGRLVSAEKLADDTRVMAGRGDQMTIATSAHSDRALGGYFLITAPSLDDAIALARTHPHLKYGGEVEVRPIETTN